MTRKLDSIAERPNKRFSRDFLRDSPILQQLQTEKKIFMKKANRNIQMRKHNVELWILCFVLLLGSDSELNSSTMSRLSKN